MSDMHDAPWPDSHLFSRFYKNNPQFHLNPIGVRSWASRGLDYAHPEVRHHFLSLIEELAGGYDFDVLELDFMRFPHYFERANVADHCRTMTGFIRRVREILNDSGRAIHLIPRVASSPGAAYQLGFDVEAWAREGLVDGITPANMLDTSWNVEVGQFRDVTGPRIAIYAGMNVSADHRDGLPIRYLPESPEMLRGFAAGYLAAGADGINAFNYFLARQHQPVTAKEFFGRLSEMKSLEAARGKPRIHLLAGAYRMVECDAPEQVPQAVRPNTARRFEMFLAAEREGDDVAVHVCFEGDAQPDGLWLRVNDRPAGHAVEVRKGPEDSRKSHIAVFSVPPGAVRDGGNELVIRAENKAITVLGIDVRIACPAIEGPHTSPAGS